MQVSGELFILFGEHLHFPPEVLFFGVQMCTPPCEGVREVESGDWKAQNGEPEDCVMGVDGDTGTEGTWRRG